MTSPVLRNMIMYQTSTVDKKYITEIIYVQQEFNNLGTYFPQKELRCLINATLKVLMTNPKKVEKIHKKTFDLNRKYFKYAKEVYAMDLRKKTNNQLATIYNKLSGMQMISHGYSLPTTWFVDSEGEDFTKHLINLAGELIIKQNSQLNPAKVFSILTTPDKPSLAIKEEIELLSIAQEINRSTKTKKIFTQKSIAKVKNDLSELPDKLKNKIINHYKKWHWIPYTYMGPAYELEFYLEGLSGLFREKININKHLTEYKNYSANIRKEKQEIIKELKIKPQNKRLFKIASEIVQLKAFRKDCLFYGCFVLEKLLKEIGIRLNLSLKQLWMMGFWEVAPTLTKGVRLADELNERFKYSVMHQYENKAIIYTGQQARKFLKSINIVKEKIVKTGKMQGTCACPGTARGVVRIINIPEEMGKMKKGDIMVSHTTYPALVPAMKKASAIVTDDGGVTCHAAIVARELKTPGVVGVKIATRVLKDGDKVLVDATEGIVKKIK